MSIGVDDKNGKTTQMTFLNTVLFERGPASERYVDPPQWAARYPIGEINFMKSVSFITEQRDQNGNRGNDDQPLNLLKLTRVTPSVSSSAQSGCRYFPGETSAKI